MRITSLPSGVKSIRRLLASGWILLTTRFPSLVLAIARAVHVLSCLPHVVRTSPVSNETTLTQLPHSLLSTTARQSGPHVHMSCGSKYEARSRQYRPSSPLNCTIFPDVRSATISPPDRCRSPAMEFRLEGQKKTDEALLRGALTLYSRWTVGSTKLLIASESNFSAFRFSGGARRVRTPNIISWFTYVIAAQNVTSGPATIPNRAVRRHSDLVTDHSSRVERH